VRKAVLIILDGWGLPADPSVSAIDLGSTPFYDGLFDAFPHSQLEASGRAVGLPEGQMGNSEVGHMNLGAGRVVYQDLVRIDVALEDGSFGTNPIFSTLAQRGAAGQRIHLLGLLSDGGVHSHIAHVKGILSELAKAGAHEVFVHGFTDGRDTDPQSGQSFIADLEQHMTQTTGRLATLTGRYYAMDRDKRWERVKIAYDALVHGQGTPWSGTGQAALASSYAHGTTDEFLLPHVLDPNGCIRPGDAVFFMNYRTDRGRELTQALSQGGLEAEGMHALEGLHFVTLTRYDATFKGIDVVFEKDNLSDTLGEVLERAGKTQVRIAETEKYPHVTFFFSGGREEPFDGESRILRASPKVATYDLQPEMSAFELRDALIPELKSNRPDFVCLNFANPDMVGHTGVLEAAIRACEVVDQCAQAVTEAALEQDYSVFILADHGNADCMRNPDGSPHTAHTTRPVPFFLVSREAKSIQGLANGVLGDVAPTILDWMQVPQPAAMTCKSLIVR
jgi:2,3-bisphosphoglycerate-independent phosphoglycerate mutase